MAVRTIEELTKSISDYIGDNSDDKSLALLEDVTDTLNSVSSSSSKSDEDWQKEIESAKQEVESAWRKKYRERFNAPSGNNGDDGDDTSDGDDEVDDTPHTFDDLFGVEEE